MGAELLVRTEKAPFLEEIDILLGQHCDDPAITIPVLKNGGQ
jgi:hypothetical protein